MRAQFFKRLLVPALTAMLLMVASPNVVEPLALRSAHAQAPFQQAPLTEDQIKSFLAADPDVAAVAAKMPEGMEKPDDKFQAEFNGVAVKHGFKDFDHYLNVANNIAAVLAGLDPESGDYADPRPSIDKQIAAITGDKTLSEEDRKAALTELEDLKKIAVEIEHKANIPLVQKYRNALSQMQ